MLWFRLTNARRANDKHGPKTGRPQRAAGARVKGATAGNRPSVRPGAPTLIRGAALLLLHLFVVDPQTINDRGHTRC